MAFVRDILSVLLPAWIMQIADINPSALYPNGMLMSCEFCIYRLRRGEERRPQSSVCVRPFHLHPGEDVEVEVVVEDLLLGWDQVQDLLPFCWASPAPVSLTSQEPDLGFSVEFWWPFPRDPQHSRDEGEKWGYLELGNRAVVSAVGISYRRVMNWGSFSSSKDNWFFS